ncbi:MAG: caspase family protein [Planctomycetes bacterium]|nr:caspase family protein [Planctomycetota bacterium]
MLASLIVAGSVNALQADGHSAWVPAKTRVFIVALAEFQNGRLHSFTKSDRLDNRLAEIFEQRGVPASQILLLKDSSATTANIEREFQSFLKKSHPGELLFFLFSSHGGYNAEQNKYSFYTYDGKLPFSWAFDTIEREFQGAHAILSTDCCYSGGIIDLAVKRPTRIGYACLSSTYDHQVARSGWRFIQCLNRGLAGDPVVDLDRDHQITLDELARYTARYMAFAAEGKPCFTTTGSFDPQLRFAESASQKGPRAGELLEAKSGDGWAKAEILESKQDRFKIHFTRDTKTTHDDWVTADSLRPFHFQNQPVGTLVNVQDSNDKWRGAKVVERWESLHRCRFDDETPVPDEWFGPSRLRPSLAGDWTGRFANDLGESNTETVVFRQDQGDTLHGTWSGNVKLSGERIGKEAFFFEARTANRLYRAAGHVADGQLSFDYCAHRTQGEHGNYYGWASYLRDGDVAAVPRNASAEFAGTWAGVYENSRSSSGPESLELKESAGQLRGVWSDVPVTGERLGSTRFYLRGTSGKRAYLVAGWVSHGQLRLDYSATDENDRYFGWSTLQRP